MEHSYKIEENKIIFNDKVITVEDKIADHLVLDNVLVVVIDLKKNKSNVENAFGIDLENQKIIWQIQDPSDKKGFINWITLIKHDKIALYTDNYILTIDHKTGKVLEKEFNKYK